MDGETAASAGANIARPRRRASVSGVIGEILITIGVVVMLYVVWQLWIGDLIYGSQGNAQGASLSEQWDASQDSLPVPVPTATASGKPVWEPVVLAEPADTVVFGTMQVPRFGPNYNIEMAGGVTRPGTLDKTRIGHYPGTGMPGEVGNAAFAAHRTTWGAPFGAIAELRVGDAIVIEVPEGWYTYRFRTLEYVQPTAVDVLLDVPQAPGVPPGERYLTLTSCSPKFSLAERIVAYAVYDSFQPRAEGAPDSLTEAAA